MQPAAQKLAREEAVYIFQGMMHGCDAEPALESPVLIALRRIRTQLV
jgi:hypothetical protein